MTLNIPNNSAVFGKLTFSASRTGCFLICTYDGMWHITTTGSDRIPDVNTIIGVSDVITSDEVMSINLNQINRDYLVIFPDMYTDINFHILSK